ncbi:hypothetical protein [Burkholderia anthina]|uniref:hypothetical protein n=1 Tax=Burkholderia anthina TaxID=179879 RepID=UPI001AA0A087|nr:hypothetical protein [Burkholderia anthina]QTD91770.1 hypothetical protein J4G50_26310 [Burkholderia anthina]
MTIEQRLENWARTQRAGNAGSHGGSGLTANIYFSKEHVAGRSVDYTLDLGDAERVNRAFRKLMPLDRDVLRMHFVFRAQPAVICRKLGLKVRPTTIFDLALAHAKRAIEGILRGDGGRRFISMQSIIDSMSATGVGEEKAVAELK